MESRSAARVLREPCAECGAMCESGEYHPYAFCVLVKARLNPLTVVLEAAKKLKIGGDDADA